MNDDAMEHDSIFQATSLPRECPIFPLPNCVLFPKVLLPLRIFETRYKEMLAYVLDTQGWLAVAMWQTSREYNSAGNPDVFPVGGLGKVVNYQKLDDGTFNIVLLGERRVQFKDWQQVKPFPICTVEAIEALRESKMALSTKDPAHAMLVETST